MKLIRIGCGCVVLVVHEADSLQKSVVRLIDYCAGDNESPSLRIGPQRLLGEHANPENIHPDKVQELSPEENLELLDKLAGLVNDGYRFRELQSVLKRTVQP